LCSELTVLIARGAEMRPGVGLDSKRGPRKMFRAQSYRKFAEEISDIARVFIVSSQPPQEMTDLTPRQMISDKARDIALSKVPQETHDEHSETFSRTIAAAEATYRHYLSCKDLFPTHKQEYSWAKSIWPVACPKTGTRFSPPGDLREGLCTNPRGLGIVDVKAMITPLVERFYGFETEEVTGN
jgi:hypothetical protein